MAGVFRWAGFALGLVIVVATFSSVVGTIALNGGALGFNRPRNVMQYRRLIAERGSWDDALALANA